MTSKITTALVHSLAVPSKGNKITYDAAQKGFGIRVTANGKHTFVFNY